jgi:PST family polysaccharide transporter
MALVILGAQPLFGGGAVALFAAGAVALACYVVCVLPSRGFLLGTRGGDTA